MKVSGIAERIAEFVYRHRAEINPVPFTQISRDLKACLICMPGKLDMIKPAAEILPEIAEAFSNRSIKILLTSSVDPQSHDIIKKFVVVRTEPSDVDRFSLPRAEFIKRLSGGGLGMAIDLDTSPNFFNALVALRSGAAVRTAFDKGVGLPYYNLIVGTGGKDLPPREAYRIMADILRNFKL